MKYEYMIVERMMLGARVCSYYRTQLTLIAGFKHIWYSNGPHCTY